jgi:DNA-directed RNA polymerase
MMLVRAAGRKLRRDAFNPLRLSTVRSLATSNEPPSTPWAPRVQPPGLSEISQWDPKSPLVVREAISDAAPALRSNGYANGGDPVELHQNLYACLRVGRVDRANMILKRLATIYLPWAPEMVDAHNVFLQTLLELAQEDPKPDSMDQIEQWYADNMLRIGIQPDAHTFITLLRAALSFTEGAAQEAALRHYLDMANASGPDVVDQINTSPEFTDEEWDIVIRMQPDTYDEPPSVETIQDLHINSPAAQRSLIDHGFMPTTHIKPVPQKGLGLDSLKHSLQMFVAGEDVAYPHDMEGTKEEKDRAYAFARQIRVEKDSVEAAVERWKKEESKLENMGIHGVVKSKPVQTAMYGWYTTLLPLLKKQIERASAILANPTPDNAKDDAHIYGVWLERCKPEQLAALVITRVIQSCVHIRKEEIASLKVAVIASAVGTDVESYLNADAKARRDAFLKKQRKQTRMDLIEKLSKSKAIPTVAPEPQILEPGMKKDDIPIAARIKIGGLCLEALMQSATITTHADDPVTGEKLSLTQAAFHHQISFANGKKVGWIVPHHQIVKKLRNENVSGVFGAKLPMLVEPKPWTGFTEGGYYTQPQKVVRQKSSDTAQRAYAQTAIENGDMKKVLAGLDVLGKVPWKINTTVLDVMVEVWNSGEGLAGLIPEKPTIEPPPEPPADATYQARAKWGKAMQEYENEVGGLHSQRCFQNFVLEVANSYRAEPRIYYPHSVDFRGRAYPIPPILNHIGADVSRGLLLFGNRKELGTVGLQWLKIHLANLYGFDKASLQKREQFAMDNIDEVYDSATNPLSGNRWWANAEDPWQCLACCIELKSALDAPDPTRYESHFPVHQDGTCNGLQHYAALGGDQAGARQVNLEPSDRPQDIYTGVAELVQEIVDRDAAEGKPLAKFIQGHVTRKVVKRTVMTNVYGVTFMGAKEQVYGELKTIFTKFEPTKEVPTLANVALYVAQKIFEALGRIFNGAQDIQFWLNECGTRITTSVTPDQVKKIQERYEGKDLTLGAKYRPNSNSQITKKLNKTVEEFRTGIIWTTPLKMPIVQPYRKDSQTKIRTKIQDITVTQRSSIDAVDKRKQLQAFPPNFIHSLDATHMLLSALKCAEENLDFAAVHDSFWTHPSDIPKLNTILRDAFVRMHSEDITGRLAAEFDARYAGHMYRAEITQHSRVAQKISKWRSDYRMNNTAPKRGTVRPYEASFDELALESQRQELLQSEDPEMRAKGEQMVTPTSIWNDYHDPKSLKTNDITLLGDTAVKDSTKLDEVKNKVLGAEEETMKSRLPSAAPTTDATESALDAEPERTAVRAVGEKKISNLIQVWLPLTFPPVPKKGDWDVSRLRESKYFFS